MKKLIILAVVALVPVATALAAGATVVHPGDMHGWVFAQEDTPTGSGALVSGPGTPPLGSGSANLVVDGTGREILVTAAHNGARLDSLGALSYSTYRASGSAALAPALQFDIDVNSADAITTYQGRLVYEPYFTHTVVTGAWQTWNTQDNAGTGNWWFTKAPQSTICGQSNPCTWSEIQAAFPNASIRGATMLKAGLWAGGFNGNVDAFTIGDTTYDFEAAAPAPTTKQQCKDGGWRSFTNPAFKNQGACIKFVKHAGHEHGDHEHGDHEHGDDGHHDEHDDE